MKKIVLGLYLLFAFQIYAQAQKDPNFEQKVFQASFGDGEKTIWPQVNNEFYFFLIKDNSYIVECTNSEKKAWLLPKGGPKLDTFKIETDIMPDRNKNDEGIVGIALDIQEKLSSGYLIQFNSKSQFRVVHLDGNSNFVPISNKDKGDGWVSYKTKNSNDYIRIVVIQTGAKAFINIDSKDVFNFDNSTIHPGQMGLFITGMYKSRIKSFVVYKTGNPETTTNNQTINTDIRNNTDLATINNALLDCRNTTKEQSSQITNLNIEIAQARKKNAELQTYISDNLDMKLQTELQKQKEKADKLQAENDKLNKEMGELRELKKIMAQNKDGDLIMVLSGKLKEANEKNEVLEQKITDLTAKKKNPKRHP